MTVFSSTVKLVRINVMTKEKSKRVKHRAKYSLGHRTRFRSSTESSSEHQGSPKYPQRVEKLKDETSPRKEDAKGQEDVPSNAGPASGYPVVVQVGFNNNNGSYVSPEVPALKMHEQPWSGSDAEDPFTDYPHGYVAGVNSSPAWVPSDASPPSEPLHPTPSPTRTTFSPFKHRHRRGSSKTSTGSFETPESIYIDKQPIFLTPREQILVYPRAGTAAYYEIQATYPYFAFGRRRSLQRSKLTEKMIELFRDPRFAPSWGHVVPDYYAERKREDVDLEIDEWVRYWEGLVVRADIRRGGELAKKAARMLAAEKGAEF